MCKFKKQFKYKFFEYNINPSFKEKLCMVMIQAPQSGRDKIIIITMVVLLIINTNHSQFKKYITIKGN